MSDKYNLNVGNTNLSWGQTDSSDNWRQEVAEALAEADAAVDGAGEESSSTQIVVDGKVVYQEGPNNINVQSASDLRIGDGPIRKGSDGTIHIGDIR